MTKTRRLRGGMFEGVKRFLGFKTAEEKCTDAKAAADKACSPGEAAATEVKPVADASAEMAGAPAAPPQSAGRSRRRRQTRRKYKGGKHRTSH
jgi:hypothetical protein